MEAPGFPEHYSILPTPRDVGRFLVRALDKLPTMLPKVTLATHGDHPNSGAAPMLDELDPVIEGLQDGSLPPHLADECTKAYLDGHEA